jgi:hypothetical protein
MLDPRQATEGRFQVIAGGHHFIDFRGIEPGARASQEHGFLLVRCAGYEGTVLRSIRIAS